MEPKRLNLILGAVAAAMLLVSFSSFAYVQIPKGDPDALEVNGISYTWDGIFDSFEAHDFVANERDFTGISLEDLILDSGVESPESHGYRLSGLDGYQKDVTWSDIQNGYLAEDGHRAVFPGLTQSFWVSDLASIEVI